MTENTIAVLPFVNMSPDPENEYFCDGITEEIINALAQINQLKVTSRTSSFHFKNQSLPLKEVAQKLGVSTILEGSIRISGKTVRITAQLIHTADDFHFWSESWDRKLENIFEIQDEISLLIADKLREQLGHFEIQEHLVKKQTDNLDAYAYSLRAKYLFNKWNPTDVKEAARLYEQAIDLDPTHAESHVGLADAYGFLGTTEILPREEAWQKAATHTQRAFLLDPENAGVHYQLANISFFTECDFQEAVKHTQRSLELKPNYPEAQQFMAFLYTITDEMGRARQHLQLALSIDPLSQETLFFQAYFNYRNNEYKKALDQVNYCLEKNPKNIPAYIIKCYCLLKLGNCETVLEYLSQLPEDIILPSEKLGITCLAYLLGDHIEESSLYFDQLQQEAEDPIAFQAHSYLFLVMVNMKRTDEAFNWLDKAIALKSSVLLLTYSDPLGHLLRADPRYETYKRKLFFHNMTSLKRSDRKGPLLDQESADFFVTRLLRYIKNEEPFLNPNLSLRSLAEQIEMHPNQLSWLLNERIGKNFNEFINHFRLAYFKQLALDPDNTHISLIGLAYESGFNSKTVFNTFFKKAEGITPKEFVKKQHSI